MIACCPVPESPGIRHQGGKSVLQEREHDPSADMSADADTKHTGRFRLVVDDRECRGPMPAALAACDTFAGEIRCLPVGDYCLDDALLFERKTLPDLAASIKDGRLFAQALRLAKAALPAALILEGSARDLASSGMRVEAIRGVLVTIRTRSCLCISLYPVRH